MAEEKWKWHPDWIGLYKISTEGKILSLQLAGKLLTPTKHIESGHMKVNLTRRNGKTETKFVSRLVLETFVGSCPEGHQAKHLNENLEDNRLSNLAWESKKKDSLDE